MSLDDALDADAIIRTLTSSDATLVATSGCGCLDEQTLPDVRAGLTAGNDHPDLYVRSRHAEDASLTADPSVETAVDAVARAADAGGLYIRCSLCDAYTPVDSTMEGTTGTDDGNRPAAFLSGSGTTDSPPKGLVCVALDEMLVECPECDGTAPRGEVVREGPEAPELGWRYCQCPTCRHRWHVSAVEQTR